VKHSKLSRQLLQIRMEREHGTAIARAAEAAPAKQDEPKKGEQ
jgi:hypothetical protein